ncbi:MAG: molybdopterin-dependent oxidoreductase [Proteobacteria bacterium]|nr:molybdopterin-dependent oxidoreductase [Pseudomonadota bacterium]
MHDLSSVLERLRVSRRHFTYWIGAAAGIALLGGSHRIAFAYRRVRSFLIRSVEGTQRFDPETWQLKVDGLVEKEKVLTYQEILDLPTMSQIKDFRCVEGWGLDNQKWEGFHLRIIFDRLRPKTDARYVTFYAMGGKYSDSLTIQEALEPETMLAYKLNDKLLRPAQGRPLRLVVPRMYGYKSVKWVERMTLTEERHIGYWERRGYPVDASISG